jgi:Uma2 family endonuclease
MLGTDARWRECELWDGLPVVKEPSGGCSSFTAARLLVLLGTHVHARDLGWVGGADVAFCLRRNPDRVLSPDAAFVSYARLPALPPRGYAEVVPEFVAEVASPTDRRRDVFARAILWGSHGVAVVWVVDPLERRVWVVRPGAATVGCGPGGVVSAEPALPGFVVAVDDLFPRRGEGDRR